MQPDVPDALIGDAGRLRQVLLNLVGNAIKFTEAGEVVIGVEAAGEAAPDGEIRLRFVVSDTGIGIPPDKQKTIFRAFEQADSSTTRRYGGTGLGLTIATRLVNLMHGTITVESEPGRGSTFAFTALFGRQPHASEPVLSAGRPAPAQETTRAPAPARGSLHVLVAEDNEFNALLVKQLLLRRGHSVRLASNGRAALDLAQDRIFDLLLLDVHMPEMDGFQVVSAVRERERAWGRHLPVIALTARSRKEDRERCLAAGMDDFVCKPVRAADLWTAIDRVVGARGPSGPEGANLLVPGILWDACGGDAGLLDKICAAFQACVPVRLAAVQDALRQRASSRLRDAAHNLSGMLGALLGCRGRRGFGSRSSRGSRPPR